MSNNLPNSFREPGLPLYDLEKNSSKTGTHVTAVSADSQRPVLGRRKTSEKIVTASHGPRLVATEEDTINKVGNFVYQVHSSNIIIRYALYIIPVGALLAIPLILAATVTGWKDTTVLNNGVKLIGVFIWLEMVWVELWIGKLAAKTFPVIFEVTCGVISVGVRKYAQVIKALEIPISLLLWMISAWASTRVLDRFRVAVPDDKEADVQGAIDTMRKVFVATIVVACIFLAEKTIIQLVSINYHRKQYESKIRQSKKLIRLLDLLYDASRKIFPEFCREFDAEDSEIQGNAILVRDRLAKAGVRTKIFNQFGRAGDKVTAAFGAMASDITGKQVGDSTSAHAIVIEALETQRASKALARRLWLSFVAEGKENLFKEDLVEVLGEARRAEAEEIFSALDRDDNGDVSLEEMTMLIVSAGTERRNRAKSMADVSDAIGVLDKLLAIIVLIITAFVYAWFFSTQFANSATQTWSTFTGLAFAIGGTVTEFLSCCIFLFVKHPYDVGDRVDINDVELVVEHISLMYSVFRRIDSDKTVQIPHNVANTLWIENVSRSKHMKERYNFSVSAATSANDIEALRRELESFVRAHENRRDFKEQVDIQLVSLGDMKQLDLRVEIRHKVSAAQWSYACNANILQSNFANEMLRKSRRNKFMCALLAAMRRVPIEPPGGSSPALGDFKNPSYNVSISDIEAMEARAKHAEEVDGKRLIPKDASLTPFGGLSTALENPITGLVRTMTGRRGSLATVRSTRLSLDNMAPSPRHVRRTPF